MPNRYLALKQQRHDLLTEARTLDLSDEEQKARFGEVESAIVAVDADLLIEERRRELERNAPAVETHSPQITQVHDREEDRPYTSIAEQLLEIQAATVNPHIMPPRLQKYRSQLGHNVGRPSEGGFLLQTDFIAGIWQRVYELGEILRRCFQIPIDDNALSVKINALDEVSRANGARWAGVRSYWLAEAAALTASTARFREMEWSPKKMGVLTYATAEMLRSPATLEAVINQTVPQEIVFLSEDSIFRGDGAGKPVGILNCPARIQVDAEIGQAATTIVSENISKMWGRMWGRSRRNAIWLINQDCEPMLDTLGLQVGLGGVPTYMPPGGLADVPYGRLKGRPVLPVEYASTLGTAGDIVLADFSQYGMSDRGSIRSASSIHVEFLTDQTAYRFLYEIDGKPLWNSQLTPYQGTNTLSPFITLAGR